MFRWIRNLYDRWFGDCPKGGFHDWLVAPHGCQRMCRKCGAVHIWKSADFPFEPTGWHRKFPE